jgi:hypothetical protein
MNRAFAVIFDTNAYHGVPAAWPVHTLVAAERARNITSYASPYVIMELASHLGDESDPDYAICRHALTSLYYHCRMERGDNLRSLPLTEAHVAKVIYERDLPRQAEEAKWLGNLAWRVATAKPGTLAPDVRESCRNIAQRMELTEAFFGLSLIDDVILDLNPNATDWSPFGKDKAGRRSALDRVRDPALLQSLGVALVAKTRLLLGLEDKDTDLAAKGAWVIERLGVGLRLYRSLLQKIVESGVDFSKKKHINATWDMEIAFVIGETVQGQELCLVTGDRDIRAAAESASLQGNVLRLEDYLSSLQTEGR